MFFPHENNLSGAFGIIMFKMDFKYFYLIETYIWTAAIRTCILVMGHAFEPSKKATCTIDYMHFIVGRGEGKGREEVGPGSTIVYFFLFNVIPPLLS